jgi:cell fate (sporulation/competence/biofilm development) regulator YmcA (YheA/YmcA/DUF963 family)
LSQSSQSLSISHRDRILQKTQELVDTIQSTEIFTRFKQAENKLNRHPDGQALLFLGKAKRNAYSQISLRHGYDHPESQKAKAEYDDILRQIQQIPLIEEYQISQEDLNELLQGVTRTIINTLSPDLPTEIYEESGAGCGSGGCGGSCKTH